MMLSATDWRNAALILALALAGCTPGEEAAEQGEEVAPAAEAGMAEESGTSETGEAAAEVETPPEMEAAEESPGVTGGPPGAVAPATGGEAQGVRKWVLPEFARAVEDADVEWLEANGFHVDSVMSETLVRGWLAESAGAEAISSDPRIARVRTQMR
jgi:hypothetical protein